MNNKVKYLILLVPLNLFISLKAQVNLVPNESFKEYDKYYNGISNIIFGVTDSNFTYRSLNWFASKGSPDLFTFFNTNNWQLGCKDFGGTRIPDTFLGFQYPRTDSCYIGLSTWGNFWNDILDSNRYYYREWAGVRLLQPLKQDVCYEFTMYVSRAEKTGWNVSALGAYITKDSLLDRYENGTWIGTYPLDINEVSIQQNPDSAIWDTVNWVPITGTYKAKGGEKYLYIGNMLKDEYYTPLPIPPYSNEDSTRCQYSYYFIDDVSLYEIEENCAVGITENSIKPGINIYPNPTNGNFTIELTSINKPYFISVVNTTGTIIKTQLLLNRINSIDLSELKSGLYIIRIFDSQGRFIESKKLSLINE